MGADHLRLVQSSGQFSVRPVRHLVFVCFDVASAAMHVGWVAVKERFLAVVSLNDFYRRRVFDLYTQKPLGK